MFVPKNLYSTATSQPQTDLRYPSRRRLSAQEWDAIAVDLMGGVQASLSDRAPLEENLKEWNDLYEMLVEQKDWPWPNAANVFVPILPSELESLLAYISAQVLVPHPFLVTGNTSEAAKTAYLIERYYNYEYKKQRGTTTWFDEFVKWLHLGLRDGTGYVEALWKYKVTKKKVDQYQPRMEPDPETQQPAPVLGDDGKPIYDKVSTEIEDIHNDVELKAVELRNILTIPASATSIEDALAVVKVEYLYEDQLMELVHEGVLDEDEVERALCYVPTGTTELPTSPQPTATYTDGEQIGLGGGQGSQTSKFFRNRGPIEIYRVHSRQYDLDNDGTPEENVFWVHRATWRMLGWMRYQYFNGLRPFFPFSPFPRPNRLEGFSLCERLAGIQNEINAQRNNRLDYGNLVLSPPNIIREGSKLADDGMSWGLNQTWETENPKEDYAQVQIRELPATAFVEEDKLKQDARDYTGLSMPMMGQPNSGRRSATEARQWQAAAMTRTGLLAMRFRMSIRSLISFVHALKKQYLNTDQQFTTDQQQFNLPLPVFNQDYTIDMAGASDPIDAAARRTETIAGIQTLMQLFPSLLQDPMRQFYLAKKFLSSMNWDQDADQIIGTEQELQQQMQAQAQAAQAQQMMQGLTGQQPQQPGQQQQQPPQGNAA